MLHNFIVPPITLQNTLFRSSHVQKVLGVQGQSGPQFLLIYSPCKRGNNLERWVESIWGNMTPHYRNKMQRSQLFLMYSASAPHLLALVVLRVWLPSDTLTMLSCLVPLGLAQKYKMCVEARLAFSREQCIRNHPTVYNLKEKLIRAKLEPLA